MKSDLIFRENFWGVFMTAIVLLDRLGSGLPPGPVCSALGELLACLAVRIELATKDDTKTRRSSIG
jgi:hypothetical protein